MTIYVDVSEARAVSRLHPKLAQTAQKVVGLEQYTGADILITAEEGTLPGNVNRPPGSILIKKFVENGVLVQRKTGSDMLNSIPNLHNLIVRMRATNTKMCWLLVTGYIVRKPENNKVLVEGRLTDWNWNAYQAAIDAWQILGGYTHNEPDDLTAVDWLIKWDEKLPILLNDMKQGIAEKPVTPKLGMIDPHPERATLMSFPGCGDAISMRIMDQYPTLAAALEWMSQPNAYGVNGVGEETIKNWRKWMGLQNGEVLSRFLLEGPTVHGEDNRPEKREDLHAQQERISTDGKSSVEKPVAQSSRKRATDFNGSTTIPNKRTEPTTRDNRYKDE